MCVVIADRVACTFRCECDSNREWKKENFLKSIFAPVRHITGTVHSSNFNAKTFLHNLN